MGIEMFDGCLDRTAVAVAQHHNQGNAQFRHGIFDAPFHRDTGAVHDVTSDADHK
jgi:hypothetical protein